MPVNGILIIVVLCLYLINNTFLKCNTTGALQYFFICYFNDIMCPFFLFSYSNILLLTINKKIASLGMIIIIGVLSGLVWEFFAPVIKPTATADFYDIVCYIFGSLGYYSIIKVKR